eukprot:5664897-Pleurochrysis_carterae.AAC.1
MGDSDSSSDLTFNDDDTASPSAEVPELAPNSADAGPLEEARASPCRMLGGNALWLKAMKGGRSLYALMDAMKARTKLN